jgi:preprotein translocase SecE subunit
MQANRKDGPDSEDRQENSPEDIKITPQESENTELVAGIQVPTEDSASIALPVDGNGEVDSSLDSEKDLESSAVPFPVLNRRQATSQDRSSSKKEEEPLSQIGDLRQFIKEVVAEFKKITWPAGKEVAQATWSVLALVAVLTLLVLGFDWILAHVAFGPLEHWARLHGGGTGRSM